MVRTLCRLAAALCLAAGLGMLGHPAGAVEPGPGTKNFTPPPGVPNYFANEAEPFSGEHPAARMPAPSRVSGPRSYAEAPREVVSRRVVIRHVAVRRVVHGHVVVRHIAVRRFVERRFAQRRVAERRTAVRRTVVHRVAVRHEVRGRERFARRPVRVMHAVVRRPVSHSPPHRAARHAEARHHLVKSGRRG